MRECGGTYFHSIKRRFFHLCIIQQALISKFTEIVPADCAHCVSPDAQWRTIKRSDLAWAFLTNIPITPGHALICPVRHVQKFSELSREEKVEIFKLMDEVKDALRKAFGAEGFNHAWNEEKVAGQSIPHFHLHVVPRTQGDEGITEYEPRKFLYRPGSRETTPEAELRVITKKIAGQL